MLLVKIEVLCACLVIGLSSYELADQARAHAWQPIEAQVMQAQSCIAHEILLAIEAQSLMDFSPSGMRATGEM